MYWQDEESDRTTPITDEVVDLVFSVSGRELPCDHAWPLFEAICEVLPWFGEDPDHGLHLIDPAPSGNGWYSPTDMAAPTMYLPRRAKLVLRLPKERLEPARELQNRKLEIGEHALKTSQADVRQLSLHTTVNAKHVWSGKEIDSEADFLEWARRELVAMDIGARRMVVGRTTQMRQGTNVLTTRSLMLADLKSEESLQVQRHGLGAERRLGCGLFTPHKSVRNILGD